MGVESKGSGQIPSRRCKTSRQGPQPVLADFHPGSIRISQAGRGLVNRLLSALASRPTVSGIKGKRISLGCYAMSNPAVVFNSLDSDKSGGIEVDELRMACDQMGLGLDEKQVHELMDALDTDGNRTISMDEFKELSHLVQGKYRRGQGRCADPGNPEGLSNVFAMYNELERLVNMRRPPELIQQLFGALMLLVSPEDACSRQEMSWASFRRWIELLGGNVGLFIDNLQLYDINNVSASLVSKVKSHLRRWGLIPDAPSLLQGVAPAAANALCIWLWDNIAIVSPSDTDLPPDSAKWASPYRPTLKDKKPCRPLTASTPHQPRSSAGPQRPKSARPTSHSSPVRRVTRRNGSAGKRPNQRGTPNATSRPASSRSASKLVRPFSARLPSSEVFTPETCQGTRRPETAVSRRGGRVSVHTNALAGSSGQWPGLGADPQEEVMVELKPRIVQLHCLLDAEANGKVAAAELDPLLASHSSAIAQMVAGADRQWVDVESLLQLFVRVAEQRGLPMARSLLRHLQAAVGDEVSEDDVKPARITINEARRQAIQQLFHAAGGVPNGTLPRLRLQRAASATASLANLADLVEHTLSSDQDGQVNLQSLESFFTLYAQQRGLAAADSLLSHLQRGLGVLIERGEFEAPKAEDEEVVPETLEVEDIQQILCLHASASGSEDGVEVAVLEAAFALETGQLVTPMMQKLNPLAENGFVPETNLIKFFSEMCLENGRAATVHVINQLERGLQRHTQLEHVEPTTAPADQLLLVRRHTTADSPQGALSRSSAAPQSPAQRRASVPTVSHTDTPEAPATPKPDPEPEEEPEPELVAVQTDTPKAAETPKDAVPVQSRRRTSVSQRLTRQSEARAARESEAAAADNTAANEELPAFCTTHSSVSAASLATPLPEDLGALVLQLFWAHDKDGEGKIPKSRFDHIAPEPHAFDGLQSDRESGLVGVSDFVDFFDCMHQQEGVNAVRELLTELLAKSHWQEVHSNDTPTQHAARLSHSPAMPPPEQQPDPEPPVSRPQSRQSNIEPIYEDEELDPLDEHNTAASSIEAIHKEHEVKANHPSRPESRVSLSGSDIPDDLGVLVLQIFWAMDEQSIGKIQKEAFDEIDPTGSVFNGFKSIDTDANGFVDIEEFVNYFNVMVAAQGHDSVKAILGKLQNHFDWERRSQASSSRPSSRFSSVHSRPESQRSAYTTGLESEADSKSEPESWHSWEDRTDSHSWNRPHTGAPSRPPRPESARVRPGSAVQRTRASRPDRPESARVRMEGANGRPARYSRPNSAYSRDSSRRPSTNYSSRPSSRFSRPDSATSRTSAASSQMSSVDFPSELGLRLLHIFWALDDTGRGAVSKSEIEDLNESGVRFDDLDTDDNGFVDIDEFVAFFNMMLSDEGQEVVEKLLSSMEDHFELG